MLRKPSHRKKRSNDEIALNLVPMLDALVTMIAFLMFSMSFLAIVSIDSPAPVAATATLQKELKEKPLQLTLSIRKNESEIWSPFQKIQTIRVPHAADATPDTLAIHEALIRVKRQFPSETKLVFAPAPATNYDQIIAIMDASRMLEANDPPIYAKNPQTGIDEQVRTLFPEMIFGNLLSGGGS